MEWARLRGGLEGQRKAFEDLVCQLAELEAPRGAKSFRRKGPGADAGVECSWLDTGGGRHAWQAKFFTRASEIDWSQVEKSVKAALQHHLDLVAYTVCFAVDLSDGPTENTQQLEWNTRSLAWAAAAKAAGIKVNFHFWGNHQIDQRLTRLGREGLVAYWFDETRFGASWFQTEVAGAVANADTRYSPRVHVAVETTDRLDEFVLADDALHRLRDATRYLDSNLRSEDNEKLGDRLDALRKEVAEVTELVQQILRNRFDRSAIVAAQNAAKRTYDECWTLESTRGEDGKLLASRQIQDVRYRLGGALAALPDVMRARTVLLTGEAGGGKSHLLCNFALRKLAEGHPVVLLLGTALFAGALWDQVRGALGLGAMSEAEFLGALNSAASAAQKPAVFIVDGINEGGGRELWYAQLTGLIERSAAWSNIKFVFSIRDEFLPYVVPEGAQAKMSRLVHEGLGASGPRAVRTYFAHHGLDMPSSPLVGPEYSNPLFLRLLCEGLVGAGAKKLPTGWTGLRQAHDLYVRSLDRRLSELHHFSYDPALKVAERSARAVAGLPDRIPLVTDVLMSLASVAKDSGKSPSELLQALEREGLFSRLPALDPSDQRIRFGFELVEDLLTAELMVDGLAEGDLDGARARVRHALPSEVEMYSKAGLVAQLAVVLPEIIGIEIFEVLPGEHEVVTAGALRSMTWRSAETFDDRFTDYLNAQLMETDADATLSAIVQLSVRPDHPYNADGLHDWLYPMEMPGRDQVWSTWTHFAWRYEHSLAHFVAWFRDPPAVTDDEALLGMTTLAWLCTSSDRSVRDHATKALTALMRQRPTAARSLLTRFKFVNDPYVLERVLSAAYATVLSVADSDEVEALGHAVLEVGLVAPPNALIRDSVAGVGRHLHRHGRLSSPQLALASPVRRTRWPGIRVRSRSDLEQLFDYGRPGWEGYSSVWGSVMSDMGDFHRYVLHADSPYGVPFSRKRRARQHGLGSTESFALWRKLTPVQSRALRRLIAQKRKLPRGALRRGRWAGNVHPTERTMLRLRRQFSPKQAARLDKLRRRLSDHPEGDFDVDLIARWVFERVLSYGWTPSRFNGFDRTLGRHDPGRAAGKPERIGKKYQWLAFHELGARLADNFALRQRYRDDPADFRGIWETDYPGRDIDATFLASPPAVIRPNSKKVWWHSVDFDEWGDGLTDDEWQKQHQEIPDLEKVLQPIAPDGRKQLVLDGRFEWRRPEPLSEDTWSGAARYTWITVRAFTLESADLTMLIAWAAERHFAWAPSRDRWKTAQDELFPSHAHIPHDSYYLEHPADIPAQRRVDGMHAFDPVGIGEDTELPTVLLPLAADYHWEGGFDASIEGHVNSPLPSRELFDLLGLRHGVEPGSFVTASGRTVLRDPSLNEPGPSALVTDRQELVDALANAGRTLVWFVNGERLATNGSRFSSGRAYLSGFFWLDGDGRLQTDIKTLHK